MCSSRYSDSPGVCSYRNQTPWEYAPPRESTRREYAPPGDRLPERNILPASRLPGSMLLLGIKPKFSNPFAECKFENLTPREAHTLGESTRREYAPPWESDSPGGTYSRDRLPGRSILLGVRLPGRSILPGMRLPGRSILPVSRLSGSMLLPGVDEHSQNLFVGP